MELSNKVKHKLEEVVEIWANDHLDGRPAILAPGVYFSLESKLREQTEKIEKTFPLKGVESGLTPRVADVSAASHGKALCCYIPDQTKLDVQCQKSPEFEIWFGVNPSPDDNTLVCAEHLVEMLDDSDQFTVLRYVAAERR